MDSIEVLASFTTTTRRFAAGEKVPAATFTADERTALARAGYLPPDKPDAPDLPAVAPTDSVPG